MRLRLYYKCSIEMIDNILVFKNMFEKQRRELLSKKSLRIITWETTAGYNGDDFMRNQFTVVIDVIAIKVSRIIKRMLI